MNPLGNIDPAVMQRLVQALQSQGGNTATPTPVAPGAGMQGPSPQQIGMMAGPQQGGPMDPRQFGMPGQPRY